MSRGTMLLAAASVAVATTVAGCGVEPEPAQRVLANALCAAVPVDQVAPLLATDPAAVAITPHPEVPWHQSVTCNLADGEGVHRGFVDVSNTGTGGLQVSKLLPIYQNLTTDSGTEDRSRPDVVKPLTVQGREAYFVVIDHPGSVHRNRSLTIQVTEDATLEVLLSMSDEQRGQLHRPGSLDHHRRDAADGFRRLTAGQLGIGCKLPISALLAIRTECSVLPAISTGRCRYRPLPSDPHGSTGHQER